MTRHLMSMIGLLSLVLLLSVLGFIYLLTHERYVPLFTVNDNYIFDEKASFEDLFKDPPLRSKVAKVNVLDSPAKGLREVLGWGAEQAVKLFTTDFENYYQRYEEAAKGFTKDGWDELREQLVSSGLFEAVVEKKLSSSALVTRPPVLLRQGVLNGRYTWRIQFEMMVSYESASEKVQQRYVVTVMIVRVPVQDVKNNAGMAVDSLVAMKL